MVWASRALITLGVLDVVIFLRALIWVFFAI